MDLVDYEFLALKANQEVCMALNLIEEELWSPEEAEVNRVFVRKTSLATP